MSVSAQPLACRRAVLDWFFHAFHDRGSSAMEWTSKGLPHAEVLGCVRGSASLKARRRSNRMVMIYDMECSRFHGGHCGFFLG